MKRFSDENTKRATFWENSSMLYFNVLILLLKNKYTISEKVSIIYLGTDVKIYFVFLVCVL